MPMHSIRSVILGAIVENGKLIPKRDPSVLAGKLDSVPDDAGPVDRANRRHSSRAANYAERSMGGGKDSVQLERGVFDHRQISTR
jgi:hypothetical protein